MNQAEMGVFVLQDQEDLLALLDMRFGAVPAPIHDQIRRISELDRLQRLIIAACNAADWSIFVEELEAGEGSFKLTGERFNPMAGESGMPGRGVSL